MASDTEKLAKLESLRKKLLKKAIFVLVIFGIAALVGIILLVCSFLLELDGETSSILMIIGFLLLILGVILMISGVGKLNSNFAKSFADEFNHNYLKDLYGDDFHFYAKKGLSYNYLKQCYLFRDPYQFKSKNLFTSKYNNVLIEGSDFDAVFMHVHRDSKGNTRRTYNHYIGKAFVFTFPRKFENYLCCFEKGSESEFYKSPGNDYKIEFESVDFNKKFKSYSNNSTFAFYLMTPQVQLSLIEFDEVVSSKLVFAVNDDKLYVLLNSFDSKVKISIFKTVREDIIKNYLLELSMPLKLIDDFDVDKNKFLDKNLKNN